MIDTSFSPLEDVRTYLAFSSLTTLPSANQSARGMTLKVLLWGHQRTKIKEKGMGVAYGLWQKQIVLVNTGYVRNNPPNFSCT